MIASVWRGRSLLEGIFNCRGAGESAVRDGAAGHNIVVTLSEKVEINSPHKMNL